MHSKIVKHPLTSFSPSGVQFFFTLHSLIKPDLETLVQADSANTTDGQILRDKCVADQKSQIDPIVSPI